ncbi:HlyD family efflux transporter periplasmic adaptor subunit [uncultured Fusobacterium sp.]|uniref:efflux RND transporter periplasmic adaptor subunit n=1 Tax=uncultured Fusobacterium sp. TaxID=159267 RepID=UPI00263196B1|nr:HlyD family efflux transporter periplasmic adaptor subunit [uncultured Fusobacterium sp.]
MRRYVLLLLLSSILIGCGNDKKNEIKKVKIDVIEKKEINDSTSHRGRVFSNEKIQLTAHSAGIVQEVFFKSGDEVKEGDVLFTYEPSIIKQNEIKLSEKRIELDILETNLNNYSLEKKKGSLKNRELEEKSLEFKLKKLKSKIEITKSEIVNAKRGVKLYEEFLKEQSISIFELEEKRNQLLAKESELESYYMDYELSKQQYENMKLTEGQLEKELDYTEEKLKGQYEKLKKELAIYEQALDESINGYRAPKDGILNNFIVSPNEKLKNLQILGNILSSDKLIVNFRVPIYRSSQIKIDQKVIIKFTDLTGTNLFQGKIARVSNLVTEATSELEVNVEVEILDTDLKNLKPGYDVRVEVITSHNDEYLLVKRFSVIDENGEKYIYVAQDGKAVKTKIEVGIQSEGEYEVLNLPEGTKVILNPFVVENGDSIKEID